MESTAGIVMLALALGLLGVFWFGAHGRRLPQHWFTERFWLRTAGWTAVAGLAVVAGTALAGGGALTVVAVVATALLLAVEFTMWTDAKTFRPR